MKNEKMQWIVENYINGNLTDYKTSVKFMKKYEIVDFILFIEEFYSDFNQTEFKRKLRETLKSV